MEGKIMTIEFGWPDLTVLEPWLAIGFGAICSASVVYIALFGLHGLDLWLETAKSRFSKAVREWFQR